MGRTSQNVWPVEVDFRPPGNPTRFRHVTRTHALRSSPPVPCTKRSCTQIHNCDAQLRRSLKNLTLCPTDESDTTGPIRHHGTDFL